MAGVADLLVKLDSSKRGVVRDTSQVLTEGFVVRGTSKNKLLPEEYSKKIIRWVKGKTNIFVLIIYLPLCIFLKTRDFKSFNVVFLRVKNNIEFFLLRRI